METILTQIDAGIAELKSELERLEEAREHLTAPSVQHKYGHGTITEKPQPRKRGATHAKPVSKKHRKLERGGRKMQIRSLLEKGETPKAIAEKLDTHVNYVYLVQREDRKAAEAKVAKRGQRKFAELDSGLRTRRPVKAAKVKAAK